MSATTAGSQVVVQTRQEAGSKWFFGGRISIRSRGEDTAGKLAVLEQLADPGVGSPWHVHHAEDEAFYVLEGQMRFICGDQQWTADAGTWVYLPKDIPHGFEVVGSEPAHFLLFITPAGFENFVAELCEDEPSGPPDIPVVIEVAARYGVDILGPLPS
jgi:quercetin dioxygenase-like cupin family protein